eukprot:TRINITY_DN271_c0_g1_i2.p1 TRINITY_DN271_c0_g1~~TRINITY_DN271_c0_g1_i2.p1  ORF type:complete len:199 (+),score=3.01 TRINITY_DN271_c0_g1_i2:25-597(+)
MATLALQACAVTYAVNHSLSRQVNEEFTSSPGPRTSVTHRRNYPLCVARYTSADWGFYTLSGGRSVYARAQTGEQVSLQSVPVQVANELLEAGHRYLDVRGPDEFASGHVEGAVNIPYLMKTNAGDAKNPNFVEEVSRVFEKDEEIVVGCKSGKRSLMATADLVAAGFDCVTDIGGGFMAWEQSGLPYIS